MVVWRRERDVRRQFKSPGRLGDWTHVMQALSQECWIFTGDDYRYRFGPEAKHRFLDLLRERFNHGVSYKGRVLKWDTVIEQKTVELGRCLAGRTGRLDFSEPSPTLGKSDDRNLRMRILSLSQSEAKGLGIGKSTLHHLRNNAKDRRSFRIYGRVRRKLVCQRRPNYATLRSEFAP